MLCYFSILFQYDQLCYVHILFCTYLSRMSGTEQGGCVIKDGMSDWMSIFPFLYSVERKFFVRSFVYIFLSVAGLSVHPSFLSICLFACLLVCLSVCLTKCFCDWF